MAGSNTQLTRSNSNALENWYWSRKFSPVQPDTAAWADFKNLGLPFPFKETVGPQSITSVGAIASAQVFGILKLNEKLVVTGIASLSSISSPVLKLNLKPVALSSSESFGTTALITALVLSSLGNITSLQVVSTPKVNQSLSGTGNIVSTALLGTVSLKLSLTAGSISSTALLGNNTLKLSLVAEGTVSSETFGTTQLQTKLTTIKIDSLEAFGLPVFKLQIKTNGVVSQQQVNTPSVYSSLNISSISSLFQSGIETLELKFIPVSIFTEEAFGEVRLSSRQSFLYISGIDSQEMLGSVYLISLPITNSNILEILEQLIEYEVVEDNRIIECYTDTLREYEVFEEIRDTEVNEATMLQVEYG